jgi:transposase
MRMTMGRRAYPSDLTDEQWELLAPLIPEPSLDGRIPELPRREIVNGILYVLRSGCPWRLVPHDLPAWGTVYWYAPHAGETKASGIKYFKRCVARFASSKAAMLSEAAAIIDSQSIKTSAVRGPEKGYDVGKKNVGPQKTRPR